MSAPRRTAVTVDRLMRQALLETGAYAPTSRRRAARYLTPDWVDSVPVFDRGPARAARAEARGRP